jgi:uncharacterized protein YegP (UPF0339 family)
MPYQFLSDEWFQEVDRLIAAAGDLEIPDAMKAVCVNVTVTSPGGNTELFMKDGLFTRGHQPSAPTKLTIESALARKIFVDGDAAAGVQAPSKRHLQQELRFANGAGNLRGVRSERRRKRRKPRVAADGTETYSTKSSATRAIGSCVRAVTTYLDQIEANTTGARVAVDAGATGTFHFNLFAANGQVVLSSQAYSSEAAAWNGAFAVQDAAQVATNFAIKTSTDNRFYFTLTADNGQTVGVSQMYTTKESAQAGVTSVQSTLEGLDLI